MSLNPELIKLAKFTVGKTRQKQAVQPPQDPSQSAPPMDPSMGGAPPMDPSMGGMPPGGPPPMDPSQMGPPPGGMPPMPPDPSMGGAPPPVAGAGGLTADSIRQIMQETLGQMGMVPGQSGPGGGAAGGKPGKPDLMAMSMDIFQIKKLMTTLFNTMGVPIPQDILDGPNRDPGSGMPMSPGAPGSTSDPSRMAAPAGGGDQGGGGGQSAIKPITPMQGAFPAAGGGGGGEKSGEVRIGEEDTSKPYTTGSEVKNKAAALNAVLRRKSRR